MKKFTEYKEPEILLEDNTIDIINKCFESINYETKDKIEPWKNDIKLEITDKTINILESFIEDKIIQEKIKLLNTLKQELYKGNIFDYIDTELNSLKYVKKI